MNRSKVISAIWSIGSKQLGMDSEDVHSLVLRETGKDSMRKCTDLQLERVLKALKLMTGMQEARSGRATTAQLKYIASLEYQLGWDKNPDRMRGFLNKNNYPDTVKWLTVKQASNLIEGLKRVLESEQEKVVQ